LIYDFVASRDPVVGTVKECQCAHGFRLTNSMGLQFKAKSFDDDNYGAGSYQACLPPRALSACPFPTPLPACLPWQLLNSTYGLDCPAPHKPSTPILIPVPKP
jgi:hypothetical protein